MDYKPIQKDFETMTKETQRQVDKFNRYCKSIANQEEAIESLKNKLTAIKNGEVVPPSIKEMETQLERNNKELEETINRINELNSIRVTTTDEDKELAKLQQARADLKDNISTLSDEIKTARTSSIEVQQLKEKLNSLNEELERTKEEASQVKKEYYESMKTDSVNTFGDKIDKVGEKVVKFNNRISRLLISTMVFNVMRSGLTALRNNFVSLLKTNDQFSNSLNQIKANLMTAFTPIYNACLPAINSLMNSLSKLTGTIAVFVSGLFGKSIQETTKDAKKLSGALNKTSSSAQKASGSLASFDTLEVISDNNVSSSGTGGSSDTIDYSGEITYSKKLLDILNKVKDVVVSIWDWGTKHKELIKDLAITIGFLFVSSKIIKFASSFSPLFKVLDELSGLFVKVGEDGKKSFNNVDTGITVAIAGFILMIKNISDLINNWGELDTKQKLLKIGMAALGAAAIALGYAIATGISTATLGIGAIIAVIVTAVTAIIKFIAKLAKEEDAILSVKDAQEQLTEAHEEYVNATNDYVSAVDGADEALKKLKEAEKETGLSGKELYKSVENGTLNYADMTEAQKKVYKAYLENKSAQEELTKATDTLSSAKKAETDASFANQLAIAAESGNYDDYKKSVIEAYENGTLSAEDARDKLEQAMSRMSKDTQKTFMEDIPTKVKDGMDPEKYQTTWQKFKFGFKDVCGKIGGFFEELFTETIPEKLGELKEKLKTFFKKTLPNLAITGIETLANKMLAGFEKIFNIPINKVNGYIETANSLLGTDIGKFSTISLGRISIPRLATGAVIPPRQEFMAILGDQKHGTNIEAPLDTIKQANREVLEEVLGRAGMNGQEREIVLKNWQFILQMGNTSFGKIAIEEIKKYEKETSTQFLLA